ncbi:MAG: hypothetical protein IK104_08280 [Clostridia bacterium]|nr:hypothetical protein [Clostridia bacterium]
MAIYCRDCGTPLGENGVCPNCGFTEPAFAPPAGAPVPEEPIIPEEPAFPAEEPAQFVPPVQQQPAAPAAQAPSAPVPPVYYPPQAQQPYPQQAQQPYPPQYQQPAQAQQPYGQQVRQPYPPQGQQPYQQQYRQPYPQQAPQQQPAKAGGSKKGLKIGLLIAGIAVLALLTVYLLDVFGVIRLPFLHKDDNEPAKPGTTQEDGTKPGKPAEPEPATTPAEPAKEEDPYYLYRYQTLYYPGEIYGETYDEAGNILSEYGIEADYYYTYDEHGRILTQKNGEYGKKYTYVYKPDGEGSVASITHPRYYDEGDETETYRYDKNYRLTEQRREGNGLTVTTYEYDEKGVRRRTVRSGYDEDGDLSFRSEAVYDETGRHTLKVVNSYDGVEETIENEFTGEVVTNTKVTRAGRVRAEQRTVQTYADGFEAVQDGSYAGIEDGTHIRYYMENGRVIKITRTAPDGSEETDTCTYDEAGHLISIYTNTDYYDMEVVYEWMPRGEKPVDPNEGRREIEIDFREEFYTEGEATLRLSYPHVTFYGGDAVAERLNALFAVNEDEFWSHCMTEDDLKEYAGYSGGGSLYENVYAWVAYRSDRVISFVFSGDNYGGGAHGSYWQYGVTADLDTGRQLTITDVFDDEDPGELLEDIKESIRDAVEERRNERPSLDGYTLDKLFFWIDADGELVVYIPVYELGSYADGAFTVYTGYFTDK